METKNYQSDTTVKTKPNKQHVDRHRTDYQNLKKTYENITEKNNFFYKF